MKRLYPPRLRFGALHVLCGIIIGALVTTCSQPRSADTRSAPAMSDALAPSTAFAAPSRTSGPNQPLSEVAERVVASVVNISATKTTRVPALRGHPFFDDELSRRFFGPPGGMTPERKQRSLGSGVIVSSDGVILTNNHVVEHTEDIQVTSADGRDFSASIVGTDPKSDIAVLRLKGDTSGLTPLPFGDSSALRLGDMVLAVGNPFGVGQTVTMGIVSAKGRSRVGIVDYEDFIQTDAAINPGNSGGALVNLRGELVGINTAILSRSGGYQGIGFAIPTEMARPVMESLLEHGKVLRGWLGVAIQDLDKELAAGLGIPVDKGVLVSDVTAESPAAAAGLERGDVILSVDGDAMTSTASLRNRIASAGPKARVTLEIMRDGKRRKVEVTLGVLQESGVAAAGLQRARGTLSGMNVADLDRANRTRYHIPARVKRGVVVTGIAPGTAAQRAGVRAGDVILAIDRQPVDSVATFERLAAKIDKTAVLLIARQGGSIFLKLRP